MHVVIKKGNFFLKSLKLSKKTLRYF